VLVVLAAAVFLRSKALRRRAPAPESDGILYINLKPVRSFFTKI